MVGGGGWQDVQVWDERHQGRACQHVIDEASAAVGCWEGDRALLISRFAPVGNAHVCALAHANVWAGGLPSATAKLRAKDN